LLEGSSGSSSVQLPVSVPVVIVTVAEAEVERLRGYLEVSQTTLKAAKWEMQVVRNQQVAADDRVAGKFYVRCS
jgi:predicted DNA-binding protein (UPF0251 family)